MVKEKEQKTILDAFTCLGLDVSKVDDEMAKGTCPFCDKSNHLYLRYNGKKLGNNGKWSVPGHWYCQYCDEYGGHPAFMKKLIERSAEVTTRDDRQELFKKKRIPTAIAKFCYVVKSLTTSEWLIPTIVPHKDQGTWKVQNIHRWNESNNKLYGVDTLSTDVMGLYHLSGRNDIPLWIPEGHWDYLILEHIFRALKKRKSVDIIGVPGAKQFQAARLDLVHQRPEVVIPFDGDHPKETKSGKVIQPGLDGIKRIVRMIHNQLDEELKPKKIKYVQWEDVPDGYDLRDLYITEYERN